MSWGRTEEQQRWIDQADAAEEERARRKRELRRSSEHDTVAHLRADMQHEIANLRAEMQHQREFLLDAVGQALGELSNKICDRAEASIAKLENEIARKFGETMGRLDALAPDVRSRSKRYEFANERGDEQKAIIDLPNPLTPVIRKTTLN